MKGSASRTTCWSASSGSPSGSTRPATLGFLFGFEESHGYLSGDYARDKDAAVAALLFAELAATVKDRKQTVLEYLDDLYIDVGPLRRAARQQTLEGREGSEQIKRLMAAFRDDPPRSRSPGWPSPRSTTTRPTRSADAGSARPSPLPEPSGDLLIFHLDAPGMPVRRPAVGHRAEDQVLPVRPDRRPTTPPTPACSTQ